jgi:hypothetical protein
MIIWTELRIRDTVEEKEEEEELVVEEEEVKGGNAGRTLWSGGGAGDVTRAHTQDAHTHTPNPEPWPLNGRQKGESAEKHGDTPVQTNSQTQP